MEPDLKIKRFFTSHSRTKLLLIHLLLLINYYIIKNKILCFYQFLKFINFHSVWIFFIHTMTAQFSIFCARRKSLICILSNGICGVPWQLTSWMHITNWKLFCGTMKFMIWYFFDLFKIWGLNKSNNLITHLTRRENNNRIKKLTCTLLWIKV